VDDLVTRLAVTPKTVRSDLAEMQRTGMLVRTSGGCTFQPTVVHESSLLEKDELHAVQKMAIAREAVKLVRKNQSLFISSGTTPVHFARALPDYYDLRIFTNNLRVAVDLFSRPGFEVNIFGGMLVKDRPELVGELASRAAEDFRFDTAFMGADAIDPVRGEAYSASIPPVSLIHAVQRQADALVTLADSSKFGVRGLSLVARLREGTTLVTDDGISEQDLINLRKAGGEVIVARVPDYTSFAEVDMRALRLRWSSPKIQRCR